MDCVQAKTPRLRFIVRLVCASLALMILVSMAPAWAAIMRAYPAHPRDFAQDWASARNLLTGRPIYEDQRQSFAVHLGLDTSGGLNIAYNAHPPSSVLAALPFAFGSYASGGWWWNVTSLALLAISLVVVARGVGWRPHPLTIIICIGLLAVWVPLWLHTLQGQLGLLLLAVFVAAWTAGRKGHWALCGMLLGIAATIKLFPILLLGLLALLGRWRGVVAGIVSAIVTTALTVAILGGQAFIDYVTVVLPQLNRWRPDWINSSFTGYFSHFFAPDAAIVPLLPNPLLAAVLTGGASLCVITVAAFQARRFGAGDFDGVFSLALTGLLLLSALTWSHYFVVLLLPLGVWLPRLSAAGWAARYRWLVLTLTWILMAVPQLDLAKAVVGGDVASPIHSLTVLALNFYGLLGFFVAQAVWIARDARQRYWDQTSVDHENRASLDPSLQLVGIGREPGS